MRHLLKNHKNSLQLALPMIIGTAVFICFLYKYDASNRKLGELALGSETVSFFAKVNGFSVHCQDIDDSQQCIQGWNQRGMKPVILWLGNSQLHAINQMKQGDKSASLLLHDKLMKKGHDVISFSEPNANLQEHYVLFEYLRRKLPVKILILPLVMDDMRESGIRSSIAKALKNTDVIKTLKKSSIGNKILRNNNNTADTDMGGIKDTVQVRVERKIDDYLTVKTDSWKLRPELRGEVDVGLYKLRNYVFNISPTSKRAIIKGRYQDNMAALKEILNTGHSQNIEIITYVVPIRNDVEIPYISEQYMTFKNDVSELVKEPNYIYVNLERLVPSTYWGSKDATSLSRKSEIDFMHFQASGHQLLAKKLEKILLDKYIRKAQ